MIRVGTNIAEATTITIPTHVKGDLIIMFAFRDGSTTNPSIPAGWTTITNTFDGTSCSVSMAYRYATAAGTTSGTWTNASALSVVVYRGAKIIAGSSPGPTRSVGAGGTTSPSIYAYGDLTATASWLVAFQGHRSTDTTTINTAPTGFTNQNSLNGAVCSMAIHDTNGVRRDIFPDTNVAPGGTASGWLTVVTEIRSFEFSNNYQSVSAPTGISVGERIR